MKGKISFEDGKSDFSKARIQIRKAVSNEVLKEVRPDEDGNYECKVDEGNYTVEFVCPSYLRVQKSIVVEHSTEKKEIELNQMLQTDDFIIDLD